MVISPEVNKLLLGKLPRRHIGAQLPAGGERPRGDQQEGNNVVVGDGHQG
jgi:hypothetical protein